MATTVDQMIEFVEALKIKYTRRDDGTIVMISGDDNDTQASFIRLKEDGEMFSMETNIYDKESSMIKIASDSPHKLAIYEYILMRNFTLKFGCWEVDTGDGEIRFTVEFPLEDASLTLKQFTRVISIVMGKQAGEMFSELRRVINTGSKESSANDEIAILEAELAKLRRGSATDGIQYYI